VITHAEDERKQVRAAYATLIEQFGKGWTDGDAVAIAQLFAEDAVFLVDPHSAAIKGRPAIEEYWRDVPMEQSEIEFRFGEIFVAGPWFATEIKCTFRRRRTGEAVDVRGALFCETDEGVISEMRMYWHRTMWQASE
jgi:ketosteroid isomerase-like protein